MKNVRVCGYAAALIVAAVVAVLGAPVAAADPPGCLPLNGAKQNANSFLNTNYLFVTYATNVDYWYANGAVNWNKRVDGGSLNLVHSNTTGVVPATPGATVAIPGATPGGGGISQAGADSAPLLVTVCSK